MSESQRVSGPEQTLCYTLHQAHPEWSSLRISREVGVSKDTVLKYWNQAPAQESTSESPSITEDIRHKLAKFPMSVEELSDALKVWPSKVRETLQQMQSEHVNLIEREGRYEILPFLETGGRSETVIPDRGDGWQVFGATADNHLGNKHERLDVLNALYDRFAAEGVTKVYNAGNWIDGEAKFNKYELNVHGMDNQLDYMIRHYPHRHGMETHYVSGLDHEGWYIKNNCVNIGEYLQMRAQKQGRHDLKHLGVMEADVELRYGSGASVLRVQHAGGGSAYALSYTSQKSVESFQGGEKPHVMLVGHYHKFDYCYPREVHTVQVGCTEDQSGFMRQKKIAAHLGGVICWLKQDECGVITHFRVEWIPFYDRTYYAQSFGGAQ